MWAGRRGGKAKRDGNGLNGGKNGKKKGTEGIKLRKAGGRPSKKSHLPY